LFGFFPVFRQSLRQYSRIAADALSGCTTLLNLVMIIGFSQMYAMLYLSTVIFITMICPLIFIYAYQFKNDIQGPWDLPNVMQYHSID
jgi:phosphatidylinositol glycan class C protein